MQEAPQRFAPAPTLERALVRRLLADVAPAPRAADPGLGVDPARRDRIREGSRRSTLALGFATLLTLAIPAFAKDAPKGKDDDDDDDDDEKDDAKGDKGGAEKAKGAGPAGRDAKSKGKAKPAKKADDDDDDDETQAEKAADRFPQPVVVGSLLRRTVLQPEESKPVLGHVADIVRAKDGSLDAVVNYGGFLGFYTRPIAVPVDAMALLGEYMEILDFTPEQLKGFPTFDPVGTTPVPRSETIRVALAKPAH